MKAEITQEFKGVINGVTITNQQVFQTTEYVLEQLEEHKGLDIKDFSFTQDFVESLERMNEKSELLFDFNAFEQEATNTITDEYGLDDFAIYNGNGDDYYTHQFNKNLADGKYNYLHIENEAVAEIYKETFDLTKNWSDEHKKDFMTHIQLHAGAHKNTAEVNAYKNLIQSTSETEFNNLLGFNQSLPNRESGATLNDMLLAHDIMKDGYNATAAIHKIASMPREEWQAVFYSKEVELYDLNIDSEKKYAEDLKYDEFAMNKNSRPITAAILYYSNENSTSKEIADNIIKNYEMSDEIETIESIDSDFRKKLEAFSKDDRLELFNKQMNAVMKHYDLEVTDEGIYQRDLTEEDQEYKMNPSNPKIIKPNEVDFETKKDIDYLMTHPNISNSPGELVMYRMEKRLEAQIQKEPLTKNVKNEKPIIEVTQIKNSKGNER
ncbi:hypothetical protein [Veillonella sp.]|uniref:hypothetical protein n=1 Tax=Veillonella sp. TaxID=1926307 RepID=UPI0025F9CA0B|nr:hypothetical protein [Veillonella sp.]